MTLPNREPPTANANSSATSHHKWGNRFISRLLTMVLMLSTIDPVTQDVLTGTADTRTRRSSPSTTTCGPESQTIFSTGGTFLSAWRRSCQAERECPCLSVFSVTLRTGHSGWHTRRVVWEDCAL